MSPEELAQLVVAKLVEIPGIKVERAEFYADMVLQEALGETDADQQVEQIISQAQLGTTVGSVVLSLARGNWAYASLPVDFAQNLGQTLIAAQKLGYLKGRDAFAPDATDNKAVLTFLGSLYGVHLGRIVLRSLTEVAAAKRPRCHLLRPAATVIQSALTYTSVPVILNRFWKNV